MKRLVVLLAALTMLMAVAGPASAHILVVTNPQTGEVVNQRWVGGDTVPEPARSAPPMFGPFSMPPSHGSGLVNACGATAGSGTVALLAPPYFTGCQHGMP